MAGRTTGSSGWAAILGDYHSVTMDRVLAAPRRAFDRGDVLDIARRTFGVVAGDARDLGSERDQTFLLLDATGAPMAVMKVSNAAEDSVHARHGEPRGPPRDAGRSRAAARDPAAGPGSIPRHRRSDRPTGAPPCRRRRPPRPDVRRAAGSPSRRRPRAVGRARSSPGARRRLASGGHCAGSSIPPRSGRCCGTSSTPRAPVSCSGRSAMTGIAPRRPRARSLRRPSSCRSGRRSARRSSTAT